MDRATKIQIAGRSQGPRWVGQDKCVALYEKGSRLGFSGQQQLTVHGGECEKHLEDMFIHGRTIAPLAGFGSCIGFPCRRCEL